MTQPQNDARTTARTDRRTFLKGTSAAVAAAAGFSVPVTAEEDYDTVQANGQTVTVGNGETYENVLVDLTTGDDFIIIVEGGNSVVRNVGFEGLYRGDDFMISVTAPSGDVLIENVYLGDGSTKEGSDHEHGPGACFYHIDAGADVTFRYCNVQGYPNNGFYCSNSATGGTITWENCFAKNNGVSSYRGGDSGDQLINCVGYNDDTDYGPGYGGYVEENGRPVWAWSPGPITIEDSHFEDGPYPSALVAGANGNSSQIDFESGAYSGDIQENDGSSITIGNREVGIAPNVVPDGVPISPEEAASGGGSSEPDDPEVIEDFDRSSPLAVYGGADDLFETTTSTTYEGGRALTNDSATFGSLVSTSGLNECPERGDEVQYHFSNVGDDNFVAFHLFAQSETDEPDSYSIGISEFDGWTIWVNEDGDTAQLASEELSPGDQIDGWYRAELSTDASTISADLYDDDGGELLASIEADDDTYDSGGIGFRSAGNGEVWDYVRL